MSTNDEWLMAMVCHSASFKRILWDSVNTPLPKKRCGDIKKVDTFV